MSFAQRFVAGVKSAEQTGNMERMFSLYADKEKEKMASAGAEAIKNPVDVVTEMWRKNKSIHETTGIRVEDWEKKNPSQLAQLEKDYYGNIKLSPQESLDLSQRTGIMDMTNSLFKAGEVMKPLGDVAGAIGKGMSAYVAGRHDRRAEEKKKGKWLTPMGAIKSQAGPGEYGAEFDPTSRILADAISPVSDAILQSTAGAAVVSTLVGTIRGLGDLGEMIGEGLHARLYDPEEALSRGRHPLSDRPELSDDPYIQKNTLKQRATAKILGTLGKADIELLGGVFEETLTDSINKIRGFSGSLAAIGHGLVEDIDTESFAFHFWGGVTSVGMIVLGGKFLGAPRVMLGTMSLSGATNDYQAALHAGKSRKEAMEVFFKSAPLAFATNSLKYELIFGKMFAALPVLKRAAVGAFAAASADSLDRITNNIIVKHGYDETREIFEGLWYTIATSMIYGPLTAGTPILARWRSVEAEMLKDLAARDVDPVDAQTMIGVVKDIYTDAVTRFDAIDRTEFSLGDRVTELLPDLSPSPTAARDIGLAARRRAIPQEIATRAEALPVIPPILTQEAQAHATAEAFARAYERQVADIGRAITDPSLTISRDIQRLQEAFTQYAQEPSVRRSYEEGMTDRQILEDLWRRVQVPDVNLAEVAQRGSTLSELQSIVRQYPTGQAFTDAVRSFAVSERLVDSTELPSDVLAINALLGRDRGRWKETGAEFYKQYNSLADMWEKSVEATVAPDERVKRAQEQIKEYERMLAVKGIDPVARDQIMVELTAAREVAEGRAADPVVPVFPAESAVARPAEPTERTEPEASPELIEEARKHDTAEAFIEAEALFLHGTPEKGVRALEGGERQGSLGRGIYITDNAERARFFATPEGEVLRVSVKLDNPLMVDEHTKDEGVHDKLNIEPGDDITAAAQAQGYDGIIAKTFDPDNGRLETEIVVFDADNVKTEHQLRDIWEQAQEPTVDPLIQEAKKYKSAEEAEPSPRRTRRKDTLITATETTLLHRRIRDYARGIREGRIDIRKETEAVLKDFEDMLADVKVAPKDRAKFMAEMRKIATASDPVAMFERRFPDIQRRIVNYKASETVDKARADLEKLLKKLEPKKLKGLLKGKLTPETQESVEIINKAVKLSPEVATEKLQANLELMAKGAEPVIEAKILLENEALAISGALQTKEMAMEVGADNIQVVVNRLKEIEGTGMTERARQAFNEAEELDRTRTYLAEDVTLAGAKLDTTIDASPLRPSAFQKVKDRVITFFDHNLNNADFWAAKADSFYAESVPMSGETEDAGWWKATRDLQEGDRQYQIAEEEAREMASDILMDVYGLKSGIDSWKLEHALNEKVNLGDFVLRDGTKANITMTRAQIMAKYAQLQQDVGVIRLMHGNKWTQEVIDAVNKNIRPKDKEAVWRFIEDFYPAILAKTNPIHEKTTGLKVGMELNYSPMPTKHAAELPDQLRVTLQEFQKRNTTPGAVKARADLSEISPDAEVAPLEFDDFLMTARKHSIDMARYQAMTEPIRRMRRLLTGDARQALVQRFGRHFPQEMDILLDQMASGALKDTNNMSELWRMRSNFTTSIFALSPTRVFKESTSSILWALETKPSNLAKATAKMFKEGSYTKTGKEMWELSTRLRKRGRRRSYERDLSINAENRTPVKLFTERQGPVDMSLSFQRAGDKVGIYSFGIPYYYHHKTRLMESGLSEKESQQKAIRLFEEAFKRNQVSGEAVDLGQYQRVGEVGPLFSQFKTAMLGALRQEVHAMRSLGLRSRLGVKDAPVPKETIARNLQKIALIHAQFMLFQFVADGFRFDPERLRRAGFLGPWGAPIILGDAIDTAVRLIAGDDVFGRGAISPAGLSRFSDMFYTAGKAVRSMIDGNTDYEVMWESLLDLAVTVADMSGVPASNLRSLVGSGHEALKGELSDPRQLIFSDYSLKEGRWAPAKPKAPPLKTPKQTSSGIR